MSYTATVKGGAGGVEDAAGNPIAADKAWAFKTATPASATKTVSLVSVADTRIVENLPDTNYRKGAFFYADGDQSVASSLDISSLLRWDLSALPAGSVV